MNNRITIPNRITLPLLAAAGAALGIASAATAGDFKPLSTAKNYNDSRSNTAARGIAPSGKAAFFEAWEAGGVSIAGIYAEDTLYEMPLPQGAIGSEIFQFRARPGNGPGDPVKGINIGLIKKPRPQAILWDTQDNIPGTVHELLNGFGVESIARAANADGSVIGGAVWHDADGDGILRPHAVQWEGVYAQPRAFEVAGEYDMSEVFGVSLDGDVAVGYGAISEQGMPSDKPVKKKAALWVNGHINILEPETDEFSALTAISDDGYTAIGYRLAIKEKGVQYGIVADVNQGTLTALESDFNGDGIADGSVPYGINGDGSLVVGSVFLPGGEQHAAIWRVQQGGQNSMMLDELAFLTNAAPQGWTLQALTGISDDGLTVAGYGINPLGHTEGFTAKIPAPGAASLLSLSGLIAVSRRRTQGARA